MVNIIFPQAGSWQEITPHEAGFDNTELTQAIAFAEQAETTWPYDLSTALSADPSNNEPPPWNEVLGPTKDRGGPNGIILRYGHLVARWGDTRRVDMTFSIAKSYLAILTGLAIQQQLIGSVDDLMAGYALDDGFSSIQNKTISWRHMLQQTSEWEGTLWDKPDLIDRNRQVGNNADNSRKGSHRELQQPGDFYEYNDVRVNRLSLSLLQVFKRPLADVLRENIMDVIGASDSWSWQPYRNSWVEIAGQSLPSVPGGGHWGGGIFINSEDHARVGLLVLNQGCWGGQQLLAKDWIDELRLPGEKNPNYGYLWWLNTGRRHYPAAPETSFFAVGAGANIIWLEPALELVVVMRWIDSAKVNEFITRIMASIS